jgi:peptidoglycan/xylan/chitin deacetylase (PgdA/CDA1 family)
MMMWQHSPAILRRVFPQILWRVPTEANAVYLTFDDGPDPNWTPQVLELLQLHRAKATFFVIGRQAACYPEIVRAAATAGHSIGNHSFAHPDLMFAFRNRVQEEIDHADAAIAAALGVPPRLFRPPYGRVTPALLGAARHDNKQVVLWDINSRDYARRSTAERIVQRVLSKIHPGSIVLFHDGHRRSGVTLAALATLLPELHRRGYRCLPLSQAVTPSMETAPAQVRVSQFAFHGLSKQSSVAA